MNHILMLFVFVFCFFLQEADAEKDFGQALLPRATIAYFCSDVVGAAAVVKRLEGQRHGYSIVVDKQGQSERFLKMQFLL